MSPVAADIFSTGSVDCLASAMGRNNQAHQVGQVATWLFQGQRGWAHLRGMPARLQALGSHKRRIQSRLN
jgi:hypothetical protein